MMPRMFKLTQGNGTEVYISVEKVGALIHVPEAKMVRVTSGPLSSVDNVIKVEVI